MKSATRAQERPRLAGVRLPARVDLAASAAWALPFVLVLYLALKGGGYDVIVRSEVGLAIWWIVLLGAVVGVLPAGRISGAAWLACGLLLLLGLWTALATTWSGSTERTVIEVGRVAMYLGVLVLVCAVARARAARLIVSGVASAIAVVALLAVLARLHSAWFPANDVASFLGGTRSRLNYPLNYWNALAALMALGLPLVLSLTSSARTLVGQGVAAAVLPVMALCAFLTYSRGGAIVVAVVLVLYLLLTDGRILQVATLLAVAAGSAILIGATLQRHAVETGLTNAAAHRQGEELIAMAVVVCAGVGLLQVGIGLARRHTGLGNRALVPRRAAAVATAVAVVIGVFACLAAGVPAKLSHSWSNFKNPSLSVAAKKGNLAERFGSTSGQGRYQYWQSALDATAAHPWRGIGPGTYEFWWASHGSFRSYVRNAHSLYFETIAEEGIVGLGLLVAFLVLVMVVAAFRAIRAGPRERSIMAGVAAACVAFCLSAAIDWTWQVAVLPVAFLALAGAALAGRRDALAEEASRPARARVGLGGVAIVALVAIAIPLASTVDIRDSQGRAARSDLKGALTKANTASDVQPYAARPPLQRALVLETAGSLAPAAVAAREAARQEPVNWRNWVVVARIEAELRHPQQAIAAYRRARSLNPRSPVFAQ